MALRLGKLYDALIEAGASERGALDRRLTRLEALQWINSAGVIAILVRVSWP